jgi:intracellular septation protein
MTELDGSEKELAPGLKFALEMGPLVIFFGAYFSAGIYWATGVFMVVSTLSAATCWIKVRRVPANLMLTTVIIVVFGGLTFYFQDDRFIKMKPTIIYSMFAVTLLGGVAIKRPLLKLVLGNAMPPMLEKGWMVMSTRWGLFFIALAVLNEFIWRTYSTDFWVSFKLIGFIPVTMAFAVLQMRSMSRYALPEDTGPDTAPEDA